MSTIITDCEYKPLNKDEYGTRPTDASDWKAYPASRRTFIDRDDNGLMFVRTGGNALQAVHPDIVRYISNQMSVVVPEGKGPGDEMLVECPFMNDRLISVTIPAGVTAGSAFLVEVPHVVPSFIHGIRMGDIYGSENDLVLQENIGHSTTDVV
jgi:hypothetical protein